VFKKCKKKKIKKSYLCTFDTVDYLKNILTDTVSSVIHSSSKHSCGIRVADLLRVHCLDMVMHSHTPQKCHAVFPKKRKKKETEKAIFTFSLEKFLRQICL